MAHTDSDIDLLWRDFHATVNMTSAELRDWLAASTDVRAQQAPGVPREEPEGDLASMGWRVVSILGKRKGDLTDADKRLMEQVVAIVGDRRDSRPRDDGDAADDWRRDLMLLGHDPLRS